jgi:ATP dependent DNA ligase-like protein
MTVTRKRTHQSKSYCFRGTILYYVFDVMVLAGHSVMSEPLVGRLDLLERKVLPTLIEPVRYVDGLNAELPPSFSQPASSIWEGLVAKRRDSRYEPGLRSGAWQKMRVYQGQQFVIGGYTIGSRCFDALIFGYYDGDRLIYRANQKRLHTGRPAEGVRETAPARNHRMPVHQSAGSQELAVGPGADRGKDEGMSLGEAGARRSVRVSRMDWREPPAAHEVHRTEERQGCKDGAARITTQRRRTVMARNRHDRGAAAGTERKEGAAMMIVFNDGNGDCIVDAERQQIQDVGSGSV